MIIVQLDSEQLSNLIQSSVRKVSKGELPVMKRSKRLYFSRPELLEYLKQGRKKVKR